MNLLGKLTPVFIVLAIIGIGAGGYFYFQYHKAQKELQTIKTDPSNIQKVAQEETQKLVAEIGKLIALPEGETPTVATITDVEKLKSQPFFCQPRNVCENGIPFDPHRHHY